MMNFVKTPHILLATLAAAAWAQPYAPPISLGIYGPFTSINQDGLAVSAMFDLDFRKNFDPALRQRFGDPIIVIPNPHPDLNISLQIGTSDSTKNTGVATVLDWFLGVNGFDRVAGLVGGYFSAIALPVASNAEVFKVPQIAFGATNPFLSDKVAYPMFARTIPPDNIQGAAMWAWMNKFVIPSVVFWYRRREAYGEGLLQTSLDYANSAGQPGRVSGIAVELTDEDDADLQLLVESLDRLRSTGSKFVMIVFSDPVEITMGMYAMELEDMLYNSYQILGPDAFGIQGGSEYRPSRGYPVGTQRFTPVAQGPLYEKYLDMWRLMSPLDVYGQEAVERYRLDQLYVPLESGASTALTLSDFQDREPWFFSNFLFDAAYTFVIAINNLLHAGVEAADAKGLTLLEEVHRTEFEGVTGFVKFDENADRLGDFELWNVLAEGEDLLSVATWSASTGNFAFRDTSRQTLTWAGGSIGLTAPAALVACQPGQRWDDFAQLCLFCPANWYSLGGAGTEARCIACEAGRVSTQTSGATGCQDCEPGTFRSITGERCEPCAEGTFGSTSGQSVCAECPIGRYANETGLEACKACAEGRQSQQLFTTMFKVELQNVTEYAYLQGATSQEQCGCDRGTREDAYGECIPCTEGMICKGLNDVSIEEGYFAEAPVNHHLSIFQCHRDEGRCRGGLAGETCAPGRVGLACSECQDDTRPGDNGECVSCSDSDTLPFIAVILAVVLILACLYGFLDTHKRATQSHAVLLCGCALGQLVTVTQQLGVLGTMPLEFKEPIRTQLKLLSLLNFNIEVAKVGCISSQGPVERFAVKLFIIFFTVALMLIIHVAAVMCRHQANFRSRRHVVVGAVGSLFMIFNIAVTSTVLQPFQCQSHPNGKWTTRAYPGVLCWESEDHALMLVLGSIAFLTIPVTYILACTVVVFQLPRRLLSGDAEFLQAFAFLFVRFRSSRYTYVLIHILRSFFVALVLVLPDVLVQLFVLNMILLAGYSATLYLWPWRVDQANLLDIAFGGSILLFTCLLPVFLSDEEKNLHSTVWVASAVVSLILVLTPMAVAYGLYKKLFSRSKRFQFFLCHHKNGSGAYTRLLKMHLQESMRLHMRGIFVDSDNLDNLDYLFEYVANETGMLVVVCTKEIFSRPWCVGEMCVARLKKVPTCGVLLPSSVLPDDGFIMELEDRITDLQVLTESGITRDIIAATLSWISQQVLIDVPKAVNHKTLITLVKRLLATRAPSRANSKLRYLSVDSSTSTTHALSTVDRLSAQKEDAHHCVSIFDTTNMEAAATAFILRMLLVPEFTDAPEKIPEPLEHLHCDPKTQPPAMIIICTAGTFENKDLLKFLVFTRALSPPMMPLICDHSFRFPTNDCHTQLHVMGLNSHDADVAAQTITALFKEIAINFIAQHYSESQLTLAANDIVRRWRKKAAAAGARSSNNTPTVSGTFSVVDHMSSLTPSITATLSRTHPGGSPLNPIMPMTTPAGYDWSGIF